MACGCQQPGQGNARACYLAMYGQDHACGCDCHKPRRLIVSAVAEGFTVTVGDVIDLDAPAPEYRPDVPSREWLRRLP